MAGYHITNIEKGELGEFSKIEEEFLELKDAKSQGSSVMMLIEMADLIGAMSLYLEKHHNMTVGDLITFSEITKRAFRSGERQERVIVKKVCPQKVNGSCPLHNVHCQFPDCEK